MASTPADTVKYELRESIAWITLDRPEALNALDLEARRTLAQFLMDFNDDREALVLVITGTGNRAFCAGADVKEMSTEGQKSPRSNVLPIIGRNVKVDKPTIAAVNGLAYGAGFLIAQMCDLCIAADSASFAIPEANIGRGAPWAASLPWLIPPRVALELLMTGDPTSADRALSVGLVNQVVPSEELPDAATVLAERIARNAPLTVRTARKAVYAAAYGMDQIVEQVDAMWDPIYESSDATEGPRAFRERRDPIWKGQ